MRRAVLLMSAVLFGVAPATAQGAPPHGDGHGSTGDPGADTGKHAVAIANRAFAPARVIALEGDSVDWRNSDLMVHNISLSRGAVFSGSLNRGESFSHRFDQAGSHPYSCTLHSFMTGRVDVHPALLQAPRGPAMAGQPLALHGRAAGGGTVTIEQKTSGSPAFTAVASVQADSAGRFHGTVHPQATGEYRAVGARGASPAVTITVASELRVTLTARRAGRFTRVRVQAPGAEGATVTLQLYSRERFRWLDRGHRRLDARGRAAFKLRAGLRYHARAVISSGDGAVLATSRSVKLPR